MAFKAAKELYGAGLKKKFDDNTKAKPMKELYDSLMVRFLPSECEIPGNP
jgi:hypothetical protein